MVHSPLCWRGGGLEPEGDPPCPLEAPLQRGREGQGLERTPTERAQAPPWREAGIGATLQRGWLGVKIECTAYLGVRGSFCQTLEPVRSGPEEDSVSLCLREQKFLPPPPDQPGQNHPPPLTQAGPFPGSPYRVLAAFHSSLEQRVRALAR